MRALRFVFSLSFLCVGLLLSSCITPGSVSRIGPPRAPKKKDCEIKVLPPGESPSRPWVDIGAVLLENCQEYDTGMCRKWLIKKACNLGGEVAYLPDPQSPRDEFNNINYRVLVAVYAQEGPSITPSDSGCAEPTSEDEPLERCME